MNSLIFLALIGFITICSALNDEGKGYSLSDGGKGYSLSDEGKGYSLLDEGNEVNDEKETNGTILDTKDIRAHPHEPHVHHDHHPHPDHDNNGDDEESEDDSDEINKKGRTPYIHHDHHPQNDDDNFNEEDIEESFVSNPKKEVKVTVERNYDTCLVEYGRKCDVEKITMKLVEYVEDVGCENREECTAENVDYLVWANGKKVRTKVWYTFRRSSYRKGSIRASLLGKIKSGFLQGGLASEVLYFPDKDSKICSLKKGLAVLKSAFAELTFQSGPKRYVCFGTVTISTLKG